MKKILGFSLALLMLLVIASTVPVFAGKGPAEKATGTAGLGGDALGYYAEFIAHEGKNGGSAKGDMTVWNVDTGRELYFDVKYVNVEGDNAWFAAKCIGYNGIGANKVGYYFYVEVLDDGTPGSNGDYIGWEWHATATDEQAEAWVTNQVAVTNWWPIVDGNLVVHTYE